MRATQYHSLKPGSALAYCSVQTSPSADGLELGAAVRALYPHATIDMKDLSLSTTFIVKPDDIGSMAMATREIVYVHTLSGEPGFIYEHATPAKINGFTRTDTVSAAVFMTSPAREQRAMQVLLDKYMVGWQR